MGYMQHTVRFVAFLLLKEMDVSLACGRSVVFCQIH